MPKKYIYFRENDPQGPHFAVSIGDRIVIRTVSDKEADRETVERVTEALNAPHINSTDVARIIIALQSSLASASKLLEKVANDQ